MLWVGITGSMGTGKSTVAEILRGLGFVVLDADQIVSELLKPDGPVEVQILSEFGDAIKDPDGHLDRRALGRVVFADESARLKLESILHPKVREAVAERKAELKERGVKVAFYDVPLLFEKNMQSMFDAIVVVSARLPLRRERVRLRTGLTDKEIEARFASQLPLETKETQAHVVIKNNSDLGDLKREVRSALKKLGVTLPPSA